VVRHLARAAEELALAFALAVQTFGGRSRALADLHAALRAESSRWRARADGDLAAARVAQIFAALADVFEPPTRDARARARAAPSEVASGAAARSEPKVSELNRSRFDPPRSRWDTRAPWRS